VQRSELWRIATLNIWNRQGPWPQRLPLLQRGLRALDADVIALQEVLAFPGVPNQAEELAAGTGWHVHYAAAWQIGGGLTMGNALLSPHPLRDTASLPLPTPPGLDTRTVAFARVETPHGALPVFATHLTFQLHLGHVRCTQVRALAAHAARLAPTHGPPPVLVGDFNADPDSDEMRFLRGLTPLGGESVYYSDCWLEGPGYTFDRANEYALRTREPSRRIDYIYVRGPDRQLRGEPIASRLTMTDPVDGVWASDHYCVVADVAAAARTVGPY